MIRLASDPNARRTPWRPVSPVAQAQPVPGRSERPAHAWPFPSRCVLHPQAQEGTRPPRGESFS